MHTNTTTTGATCQAQKPLVDISPSGRVRPWRIHHRDGLLLADVYLAMAETGAEGAAK